MNAKSQVRRIRWMGGLALILGLACLPGAASAQQASASTPQLELSGAYSYLRANAANSGGGFNLNGGSGSLTYNVTDQFGLVADFGAYRFHGLPAGLDSTMYTYLFGPKLTFTRSSRFSPFAQVLFGGGRLNASSSGVQAGENGFAMAIGGGVDAPLDRHFAIRVVQAEYLITRFPRANGSTATQNNVRISAGLVFRFGSR